MNQLKFRIEKVVIEYLSEGRGGRSFAPLGSGVIFTLGYSWGDTIDIPDPPPITSSMTFVDISLCFTVPLEICMELEEKFDLPTIPWQHRSSIPTTEELQDYVRMSDGRALIDLTIADFAARIADWHERCHDPVVQRLSLVN